ncbi:M48 family metallopeptidase [Planctobacterium marinum]|uniref:Zn-dependent protease n=1 Tax=Planctobacterium marinum TaxID=1631968 RepID=A0AA48HJE2_9ALTE|nr:Zn-dependent protease [Planctobacterium marinum]
MSFKKLAAAILISSVLLSCAKSPTGRNTIKLYSSAQLNQMGNQAFATLKADAKIAKEPVQNNYVNCVADKIIAQVPEETFPGEWEVVVFEDEQINAFALPGGKIGIYTGILKVAKNQHQLAAIIGHEVGHVIAEHGNERMSQSTLVGVGMEVTNQLLSNNQVAYNQEIMAAIGLGVQVGLQLPFSRTHESEADYIGLDLMAKAGFKPSESVKLWENMDKASGGERPMEFLSTHPAPTTRIKQLQQNMANAEVLYKLAPEKANCPVS